MSNENRQYTKSEILVQMKMGQTLINEMMTSLQNENTTLLNKYEELLPLMINRYLDWAKKLQESS